MEKLVKKRAILSGSIFLFLLLFILMPTPGQARKGSQKVTPPLAKVAQTAEEHFGTKYIRHGLDCNDFRVPMTNYAVFGQFIDLGSAGGEWPKGSNEFYIYGAGIWVGGTVDDRSLQTLAFRRYGSVRDSVLYNSITDPRVVIGYNPSGGAEEFSGLTDIFISDHPEDYGNQELKNFWPLLDDEGNPIVVGIEDSYTEYDDQDATRWDTGINSNAGDGIDIAKFGVGVKVIQHTYSWNYENNKTIHFFVYDVVNIREDKAPIRNCFLTVMCDGDIGPTANDDLVGFDHSRNLGYEYDSDGAEQGFSRVPGYLGFKFLESPAATYDVDLNGDDQINDDSILINDVYVKDVKKGQKLGLTSFKTSNLQSGDPDTEPEKYLIMAGHNYPDVTDQAYAPFDLGTGTVPVDQRLFQNTGPFLLAPVGETVIDTVWSWDESSSELHIASIDTVMGDTVRVTVAVLMAPDIVELPKVADIAQSIYNTGFVLPRPPDKPNVTVVPDDKKVFISWDNVAELSKDPYYNFTSDPSNALYDPNYIQMDFEGYKLYRSPSGLPGTYELLASWDKTSYTPRYVDISQIAGPTFEGTVTYDRTNTEDYILAYGGTSLFTGHQYLVQVKSDTAFAITDLTLGVAVPPSEEADHWYYTGEPPYVFELFDADFNSLSDSAHIADGTYDHYFDGCNLLVGGMVINFTGTDPSYIPSEDVIFEITGHIETAEGNNGELAYAYTDTGLINGMTYYYDVVAYDFQPFFSPRSLSNGIKGIPTTPFSNANGLQNASAYDVQHTSGGGDGSVTVLVAEPDNVTGHEYEVSFFGEDYPFWWRLKDLNTEHIVLDSMTNQAGNDDYPVADGIVTKVAGPNLGISSWQYIPSANRWFTGVNWGGGYLGGGLDLGVNWGWGTTITASQYVTVELRFSATEQQKGYDYLRGGSPSYGFLGFFDIPFTAWDITSNPARQINIAFVENNGQPTYDSTWDPNTSSDSREYLFILLSDYSDTPLSRYTTKNIYQQTSDFDNLYTAWFVAREDAEGNPRTWTEGDIFRITPYFVNTPADTFTFLTTKKEVIASLVNLDNIKVVPNPYIVRNNWEPSSDYSRIAFTHLPDQCTIRIYTLSGDLLRTLEHNSTALDGNENWDLLTKNNQKIASGIYIFHVDSPYGEKIGKFAVVR
jgi:hypothetical protein